MPREQEMEEEFEVFGDYIPTQKPNSDQTNMRVFISETITPYRFYMQLGQCQKKLAILFDNMQSFYGNNMKVSPKPNLRIPREYILLNQLCAAIYPEDQVHKNRKPIFPGFTF